MIIILILVGCAMIFAGLAMMFSSPEIIAVLRGRTYDSKGLGMIEAILMGPGPLIVGIILLILGIMLGGKKAPPKGKSKFGGMDGDREVEE
jgi:hypothetical protein